MSDFYIGQIELFAFSQVPTGWLPCDGRTLDISSNHALFSVLGTAYGGDGRINFGLPDLRGRIAIGASQTHPLGNVGGSESHLLTFQEIPSHTHAINVDAVTDPKSNSNMPTTNSYIGRSDGTVTSNNNKTEFVVNMYAKGTKPLVQFSFSAIDDSGTQHENRMQYMALNYCICVQGNAPPAPSS